MIDGLTGGLGSSDDPEACDTTSDCSTYEVCSTDGCVDVGGFGASHLCFDAGACTGYGSTSVNCPGAAGCDCVAGRCVYDSDTTCSSNAACPGGYCDSDRRICRTPYDCALNEDCTLGLCSPDYKACSDPRQAEYCGGSTCSTGMCVNDHCYTDTGRACQSHDDCPAFDEACSGSHETCLKEVDRGF